MYLLKKSTFFLPVVSESSATAIFNQLLTSGHDFCYDYDTSIKS